MTATGDIHHLQRFIDAQRRVYDGVLAELRAGSKRSHWMWFIFPQIAGLGHSAMAMRYAIASRQEALAYLAHPLLGPRLRACTALVNAVESRSIVEIFGTPDDMKFRSCMTLFAETTTENMIFTEALARYFGSIPDPLTLEKLA